MATVTVYTAERMQEIEDGSVVDGDIVAGHLILTKHDGSQIDAGSVVGPAGPAGPTGPAGISSIPGEVKLWPGGVLPVQATYGKWVWADGAFYDSATYPIASGHINPAWKTFGGASDPGAGKFRVPDLRGLVPAGMDAMPDGAGGVGARANRMTRAIAIVLAGKTGEETHVITIPEMPAHDHPVSGGIYGLASGGGFGSGSSGYTVTPIDVGDTGGGGAHENVQPTVMVPYIVRLDG